MKFPAYAKFYIYDGSSDWVVSTAQELYFMYNDFVSINDEKHDCGPILTQTIEDVRDNYSAVFNRLPGGIYSIVEFESKASDLLNKKQGGK